MVSPTAADKTNSAKQRRMSRGHHFSPSCLNATFFERTRQKKNPSLGRANNLLDKRAGRVEKGQVKSAVQ